MMACTLYSQSVIALLFSLGIGTVSAIGFLVIMTMLASVFPATILAIIEAWGKTFGPNKNSN